MFIPCPNNNFSEALITTLGKLEYNLRKSNYYTVIPHK